MPEQKTDCLFCKIVRKGIPADIVYENNWVIAFLDIKPVNLGHTLLMPKKHIETMLDTRDSDISALFKAVRDISKAVVKAVDAAGFNVIVNNLKAAGQLIDHLHIHIVPRFENDGLKSWPGKKLPEKQMKEIAEKIKKNLKDY